MKPPMDHKVRRPFEYTPAAVHATENVVAKRFARIERERKAALVAEAAKPKNVTTLKNRAGKLTP